MSDDTLIYYTAKKEAIHRLVIEMSNEDRLELFRDYCTDCGCYDGDRALKCQCWNDE